MKVSDVKKDLQKIASKRQAEISQRFFKTGKGQYGEGDVFIGVKVAPQRKIAMKYITLDNSEIVNLLHSEVHEHRLTALLIFIYKYKKETATGKKKIYNLYLKNTKYINNWDLVDVTTPNIVGDFLLDKQRNVLYKLVGSKNLWERRISVLATFAFIKQNDFKDTLKIARLLLGDKHDLIHKAVGWMLREVGKRDIKAEIKFLDKNSHRMARTTLRYAIEKFPEKKRLYYLRR
jgi:3-methyladenine DNA glycosylase AlkD